DEAVARAEPAAAAAMRKEHYTARAVRNGQAPAEAGPGAKGHGHFAFAQVHDASPRGGSPRSSSWCTSSSLVWAKSSYQRPTARNGSGVAAHTISSASDSISAQTEGAATGTAPMMRPAPLCRS